MSYWQLLSLPQIPTWLDSGTTSSLINIGEWNPLPKEASSSGAVAATSKFKRRCEPFDPDADAVRTSQIRAPDSLDYDMMAP